MGATELSRSQQRTATFTDLLKAARSARWASLPWSRRPTEARVHS
jgi:hypothetical protein